MSGWNQTNCCSGGCTGFSNYMRLFEIPIYGSEQLTANVGTARWNSATGSVGMGDGYRPTFLKAYAKMNNTGVGDFTWTSLASTADNPSTYVSSATVNSMSVEVVFNAWDANNIYAVVTDVSNGTSKTYYPIGTLFHNNPLTVGPTTGVWTDAPQEIAFNGTPGYSQYPGDSTDPYGYGFAVNVKHWSISFAPSAVSGGFPCVILVGPPFTTGAAPINLPTEGPQPATKCTITCTAPNLFDGATAPYSTSGLGGTLPSKGGWWYTFNGTEWVMNSVLRFSVTASRYYPPAGRNIQHNRRVTTVLSHYLNGVVEMENTVEDTYSHAPPSGLPLQPNATNTYTTTTDRDWWSLGSLSGVYLEWTW